MVSPDRIRVLLAYDPETGLLVWLPRGNPAFDGKWSGRQAFTAKAFGYRVGSIDGRMYRAHRVIWALVTGDWPDADIDHINGDRADNRLVNLRPTSRAENGKNKGYARTTQSGRVGVYWLPKKRRFMASISVENRTVYLGIFTDFASAVAARARAEATYGYHPNHGRLYRTEAA